jgi:hypothetical protein
MVDPLVFIINICNHGEHYETPCIFIVLLSGVKEYLNIKHVFEHFMFISFQERCPEDDRTK